MSNRTNKRGENGSAETNGHANGSGADSAHAAVESSQSQSKSEKPSQSGGSSAHDKQDAVELRRPTEVAAIQDAAAFFDAVAARVDLVGASVRLITSEDLKISKSELDRVREMKFGKVSTATGAGDAPVVVWDVTEDT
jgi:hypothetical protein